MKAQSGMVSFAALNRDEGRGRKYQRKIRWEALSTQRAVRTVSPAEWPGPVAARGKHLKSTVLTPTRCTVIYLLQTQFVRDRELAFAE